MQNKTFVQHFYFTHKHGLHQKKDTQKLTNNLSLFTDVHVI